MCVYIHGDVHLYCLMSDFLWTDLFNQYRQLLMFSIELDIRPLAHLLLQLPAAGPALCQTLSDGKRLEDMAQEYGRRQISSCMSLIRSR